MRPKTRSRWRKWLTILGIVAIALPVAASFLVRTEAARQWLGARAVEAIHDELGLRATLGSVDVSPWTLTVTATDIVLDDPVYGRFASADALRIRPSLGAILRGKLDLESIEVDRPTVRLVMREGEIRNLPRTHSSSDDDELPFEDLAVSDATIKLDADPLGAARLEGVDLDVETSRGRIVELRVVSARGIVHHTMGDEQVDRLEVRARITPSYVMIHEGVVSTPHVRVSARQARISLPLATYEGHAEVWADLAHLDALPHGWTLPHLVGEVSVTADVRGEHDHPTGTAHVVASRVRVDQFGLGEVDLTLEGTRDQIRIRRGRMGIVKDGGHVELAGTIGLAGTFPVDVHASMHDIGFAKLMDQLGVSENAIVDWIVSGTFGLRGSLDPLALEGPIRTQTHDFIVTREAWHARPKRAVVAVPRARLWGGVSVREDGIRFQNLTGELPSTTLHGDVFIGFHEVLGVHATSEHFDARDGSPVVDFPIGGVGRASVDVTGTFHLPIVRGHIALRDFTFDTFPLGDIESDWHLEKDGMLVRFPAVRALKNDSRYQARELALDFSDHRFRIDGDLDFERMTLADFYHVFHYEDDERFTDFQATTHGRARVVYTLGFPGDSPTGTLDVDIDVDVAEAMLNGYAFTDGTFRGRWRWLHYERGYQGGELAVEHAALRKGQGSVTASGRMALGGALDITAVADDIALRDTEGIADRLADLGGTFGVIARVGGTLEVMRADVDVNVSGLSWSGEALGDARAYVRLTDGTDPWVQAARAWEIGGAPAGEPCGSARAGFAHGRWPADPPVRTREGPVPALDRPMAWLVCGEALGGRVKVDLAIGRTRTFPLRGAIDVAALELAPFVPHGPRVDPIHGTVTGRATLWGGAALADDSLVGAVQLSELRIGQQNVELRNQGMVDVRFQRGSFDFRNARFVGPSSRLSLSGGGSVRRGLATTVDGSIDLGLLASISPTITDASGRVALHVNLSGPLHDPAVFGEATIEHGMLRVGAFPEPLEDLGGRITFSARRVLFENFRARIAGGEVRLGGSATIRGRSLDHYELEAEARDIALVPSEGLEVGVGGRATLAWQQGDRIPMLRGTVNVQRLVYARPIQLGLEELSRRRRTEVDGYDPDDDHFGLDFTVTDEGPLRVANNIIDADVRIDESERPFRVVGTDQRFGVIGTLHIPRGTLRFRNAEFLVSRGVIEFDDETRIDPRFDIRAGTEIQRSGGLSGPRWRITLHAHGGAESFRLDTTSDPELSQEDIVLLLTVGMTRAEAEQLQAGDLGQTAALEALAVVTGVDREVRRAVPVIDDFRLSSAYSMRTNRTEPQISIGKRIADRVRLSATTGLSETREFRTSLEWRLGDETSVQAVYDNMNTTSASPLGNVGVDLRWRLEFE